MHPETEEERTRRYVAERKEILARVTQTPPEECLTLVSKFSADWAVLGVIAAKTSLPEEAYTALHACRSWYLDFILCGNSDVPLSLLERMAEEESSATEKKDEPSSIKTLARIALQRRLAQSD